MGHAGLRARMVVAMGILFGFYLLVASLFATHPPIEERIDRLVAMA